MESISKKLNSYEGKPLTVTINDDEENLHILNWELLSKKHNELISKMKGMSESEMGDFLSSNSSDLMSLYDYFMDDDCIEKVENKEWLPIGVLGLSHPVESYNEMGHAGLLLLDLATDQENPPVVLFLDSEEETIADSFEALEINEI